MNTRYYSYDLKLTVLSDEDYSFVAVRHLRRVEIGNPGVLYEAINLLMDCLDYPTGIIEWTECDELLMMHLPSFMSRISDAGWVFEMLSR